MPSISTLWRHALFLAIAGGPATAAEQKSAPGATPPPQPVAPEQREIWVPWKQLAEVLDEYPNAVVLSREQYTALLRDAALDRHAKPVAPRRAALTAAKYEARLTGKVVQVTAVFTVNVLSDEWSQVPLNFQGASVGSVKVDGEAAFEQPIGLAQKGAGVSPANLLLRGKGERKVQVDFTVPVRF